MKRAPPHSFYTVLDRGGRGAQGWCLYPLKELNLTLQQVKLLKTFYSPHSIVVSTMFYQRVLPNTPETIVSMMTTRHYHYQSKPDWKQSNTLLCIDSNPLRFYCFSLVFLGYLDASNALASDNWHLEIKLFSSINMGKSSSPLPSSEPTPKIEPVCVELTHSRCSYVCVSSDMVVNFASAAMKKGKHEQRWKFEAGHSNDTEQVDKWPKLWLATVGWRRT